MTLWTLQKIDLIIVDVTIIFFNYVLFTCCVLKLWIGRTGYHDETQTKLTLIYSSTSPARQRVAALARTRAARRLGTTRWVLELATAENLCVVLLGGE